jgi:hypothetical protein
VVFVFEEEEVAGGGDFWMGCGGCKVGEDEGVGFALGLANDRLIAAMAALVLAGTSLAVNGFGGLCVAAVLQL